MNICLGANDDCIVDADVDCDYYRL